MRSRWVGWAAVLVGVVLLSADSTGQPPGGFPGGGGGFPGGGGGFPGGRGGFGGGGMPDPEQIWNFMGGAGKDSIDINQNPFLKAQMERRGDPLPPGGILTKQQFLEGMQKRMAERQRGGGGMGGPPGGGPGGQPMVMQFNQGGGGPGWGSGRRDFGSGGPGWGGQSQGGGWGGGPPGGGSPGWGGPGGPNGGPPGQPGGDEKDDGKKKEKEIDYNQVGIRYGMLPPGLPDWFTELDSDKDGQVGLYEWRQAGRKTADFNDLDADGDGLLAPRELLRVEAIKAEQAKLTAAAEGSDATPTRGPGGRGASADRPTPGKSDGGTGSPPGKGGDRGKWGGGGGKKGGKN